MKTAVSIRPAILKDIAVLRAFEQGVITTERPFDPFLKPGDIQYYNIEALISAEDATLVVGVLANEIIASGYAKIVQSKQYHKNKLHAYIGFIFVKPEYRGQKISSLVLNHLKDWSKSRGIKELRLDVYDKNNPAIKAYENFGFEKSLVNMRVEI